MSVYLCPIGAASGAIDSQDMKTDTTKGGPGQKLFVSLHHYLLVLALAARTSPVGFAVLVVSGVLVASERLIDRL